MSSAPHARPAFWRGALIAALAMAATLALAGSASAAFTHSPNPVITFGPNGGPESRTNSFYYQTSREIHFDNAAQRLYLLRPELWKVSGTPPPPGYSEPPRGIFGFDMSTPGTYTP